MLVFSPHKVVRLTFFWHVTSFKVLRKKNMGYIGLFFPGKENSKFGAK
jgi:hypothetical protein